VVNVKIIGTLDVSVRPLFGLAETLDVGWTR